MYHAKTCVLCDNPIPVALRLCGECYPKYKQYIDEPWFKDLERMQHRQDSINRNEGFQIPFGVSTEQKTAYALKKKIGRPPIDWRIVRSILTLYDKSVIAYEEGIGEVLSLRDIEARIKGRVSFLTVRNVLMKYRKKDYDLYTRNKV